MDSVLLSILFASAPLVCASMGSLISDCAGRLAIFMEGMINLSAFLCFAFTIKFGLPIGCALSIIVCASSALLFTALTKAAGADPFLMGLSLNIIATAFVSLLSSVMFESRGVLTSAAFAFDGPAARIFSSAVIFALVGASLLLLLCTKQGLYIRLCGTDGKLLDGRGVSSAFYVCLSWPLAACFAAAAGCALSCRLSSFVPNVASGTGYISLVAVYMGKTVTNNTTHDWKTCALSFLSAYIVTAATEASSRLQNIFPNASSALLLSMPYLAALMLLLVCGIANRDRGQDCRI